MTAAKSENRPKYVTGQHIFLQNLLSIEVQCVKSNFGTSEFIPIQGRRVVERTISWLDNYEQFLQNAQIMAEFACMMLLLKHI